ncbi:MAG: hypothetical protein AAFO84_03355 [Cyanobacteria bacterium J06598_1]
MTAFKKLLGYPLLSMGIIFLLGMVVAPLTNEAEAESALTSTVEADTATTVIGGLIVGLPLSAAGGSLVLSANQRQQHLSQTQRSFEKEQVRLRGVLYELIEATDGRVTLVKFAIAANISAPEARTYIDTQAKAFSANFDVAESGSIVYQFPTS